MVIWLTLLPLHCPYSLWISPYWDENDSLSMWGNCLMKFTMTSIWPSSKLWISKDQWHVHFVQSKSSKSKALTKNEKCLNECFIKKFTCTRVWDVVQYYLGKPFLVDLKRFIFWTLRNFFGVWVWWPKIFNIRNSNKNKSLNRKKIMIIQNPYFGFKPNQIPFLDQNNLIKGHSIRFNDTT